MIFGIINQENCARILDRRKINMNDIEIKLQSIFRDIFDKEDLSINQATSADDIAEWDSLAHITLLQSIQDEFDVDFTIDEITEMKNVGDMIDLIRRKK